MELPTYDVNGKAEGGWLAWQTALGAVVAGGLSLYADVDAGYAATVGVFAAVSSRLVIGLFLPDAKVDSGETE